jgi:hypothetical protein
VIAVIRKDSIRYKMWMDIFATDTVAVIEPPRPNEHGQLRMLVRVTALNAPQKRRLCTMLSRQRRIPSDRVMREMEESGSVSISAEDVDVREEAGVLF